MNHDYIKFIEQLPQLEGTLEKIQGIDPKLHHIYLATPFIHTHIAVIKARQWTTEIVANKLRQNGYKVTSPIADVYKEYGELLPKPENLTNWYDVDLGYIKNCTHLIVLNLPGTTKSIGVAIEVAYAKGINIPVYRVDSDIWEPLVNSVTTKTLYNGY